jgi:hypothetical protein
MSKSDFTYTRVRTFPINEKKAAIKAELAHKRKLAREEKRLAKEEMAKKKVGNVGRQGRNRTYNPSESYDEAVEFSKGFHGREPLEEFTFVEQERYQKDYGVLGILHEIKIVLDYDKLEVIPIQFCKVETGTNKPIGDTKSLVKLCAAKVVKSDNPNKLSLFCKGGSQRINLNDLVKVGLIDDNDLEKKYVTIGAAYSIAYFTDKSHLEGPAYQKKGAMFEHVFGEEKNGEFPLVIYDNENEWVLFSGGSYEIKPEGIYN